MRIDRAHYLTGGYFCRVGASSSCAVTDESDPFGSAPFDPVKIRKHLQKQEIAKAAAAQAALRSKKGDFADNSMVTVISVNNEQAINQTINNPAVNASGNSNFDDLQHNDILWFERM